ncbi:ABC transporter related protein [Zymomonas mobilis subsp. mobilis ZM4 = ATCC 31821]|uniref:ABC transporter related protein n=2 Tax=Zymomonas mobilis subsp. mobilis TaxID=120045 RepID=Q5NR87_ZYMMO|nr:ABC transporter ATP-binding protein [Zymomonas mobilis]AAV88767.2 ABC transporter related protein [Zymomonas mobilis subsp. mobilis ZM4 = ATCC 31821]ACV75605.1 ABC transporter related [Zymomonas mobilis subsp. mobilis NCIMB 11163]AEH62530.1 ABC transporter related protein [Zymomonas mobilis subsp. mobilis ATCC 10988]AFN56950.1 Sulfate-transporting ATPase [Zymomonas mobilis subsp. mobilis ATCC 29191]AHB10392.1 ABC-type multidrug transport system, ATPase component [Zymomonas mobilis subsp. mo
MSEAAILIEGLSKVYQGGKQAVTDLNLRIPRGSIYGLLGPNGAGKSTTINVLAGLVRKTAGRVSIWGFDIDQDPLNARASIGIVPQEIFFDPFFTPFETLEVYAGLFGIPKHKRRTMELLEAVHLEDKAFSHARSLSGGMKRRLLVAKAMVASPPVLVLDEPTAGVDIELRQQLWSYVKKLNDQGVTIVLTTHYLEEAEQLCDRIAIINHGHLVTDQPTRELLDMAGDKSMDVVLRQPMEVLPSDVSDWLARYHHDVSAEMVNPTRLHIRYDKKKITAGDILTVIEQAGLAIVDVSTHEADLEDVFLRLTKNNPEASLT